MKRIIYRIFDRYLRKKAIKNHRKMWRWLAEHPDKRKHEYLEMHDSKSDLKNNCYLCDYTRYRATPYENIILAYCNYCPLDWNGNECLKDHSLFEDWHCSDNLKERKELARQIAELPERKDR